MNNKKFSKWLAAYKPLAKEILGDAYPKAIRGMSFTELHAYRYRLTLQKLTQSISMQPEDCILDIGPFPGGWASLLHEYYDQRLKIDLIGLGMTPEFKDNLDADNIRFIDFDIDSENPICKNPGQEIPMTTARYRTVSLLETIEHFFNPLPVLHKIRESLTQDGLLILTTDNPSWFGFAYQMLRYRKSPWGPVQESHLFNKSDWRPHIRLYNLQDLAFMLEHAGMHIIDSSYFNDHFGLYALKNGKLKFRLGIKPLLAKFLSLLLPVQLWANRILIVAASKKKIGNGE
ncbi:MAG: class I SAM-dependent methyltransferase [Acidobacteria bacterium]|nr:class I SAM-dependent methyltransferase [Acidobacteriota bacterium]MCG2812391.1 class I SAM-dependent methyltransferase [Candidatus Aminicenantes bacterium]